MTLSEILDRLEAFHGETSADWPTDPYEFLLWWHCGYPASDAACVKGWAALRRATAIESGKLLKAPDKRLADALKAGGMMPEARAARLKEVAAAVENLGGDLRAALAVPLPAARKRLKSFPGISDPGADRILLFAGLAPVAAVPSNTPHVLPRILHGWDGQSYSANYRAAREAIEEAVPANAAARQRAYLLLKRHGQTLCKSKLPKCGECPLKQDCAFARTSSA